MFLRDYVRDVFAIEVELASNTRNAYIASIARLEDHAGQPVALESLTELLINEWVIARLGAGIARKTVKNQRNDVLRVWQHAYENPEVECPELRRGRIRRVKQLPPIPEGFVISEIRTLLECAKKFRCQRKRLYWRAVILAAYEAGLRRGDLWRISQRDISDDGLIVLRMQKTGQVIARRVRPETVSILRTLGEHPLRPSSVNWFRDGYRQLKRWSGLNLRGFCQPLRRSGASYAERQKTGDGSRFLGHSSPDVFARSYRVPRICDVEQPLPPDIRKIS